MIASLPALDALIEKARGKVVVLTGAGVSAASGIPTFRGAGGLYNGVSVEDLATPEGFARNPRLVWEWYANRIGLVRAAQPNPGHKALAKWAELAESFTLITSNVDDLHERAGSTSVRHLHGTILQGRCTDSGAVENLPDPLDVSAALPLSPGGHLLRPNVVWFGERPSFSAIQALEEGIPEADLFVEVGHSGVVHYGFSDWAVRQGITMLRVNPEPGHLDRRPNVIHWKVAAEEALPALVEVLGQVRGQPFFP